MLHCVAVCEVCVDSCETLPWYHVGCSVLQYVAMCRSVLQCVAVCVAVCFSMLQCVLQCVAVCVTVYVTVCVTVCVAVCVEVCVDLCDTSPWYDVRCSALQCVFSMCCSKCCSVYCSVCLIM